MHKSFIKRPICFLLSLIMIAGLYPFSIIAASSALPMPFSAMGETKTADPSTMNDWVKYFNSDTTEYAGGVWTDKSVFTDASAFAANGIALNKQDDFLIALSAMASNITVEGMQYTPTDTMLLLDVSGSMDDNGLSDEMVEAAKLNEDGTTWTELGTASVKGTDTSKEFNFTNVFANAVYDKAGTYYYRITEKEGSMIGMSYDRTVHAFAVIVGDADMDGKLEITEVSPERESVAVSFNNSRWNVTANFKNVYDLKGTTASIDITKLITNESGSPLALLAGFRFELYEGDTLVATSEPTTDRGFTRLNLTFNAAGEHTYTLKEIIPAAIPACWTYDSKEVTLKLSVTADATAGTLVAKFADTGTSTA